MIDKLTIQKRFTIFREPIFGLLALLFFSFNTFYLPHGLSFILLFGISAIPIVFIKHKPFKLFVFILVFFYIILFFFQLKTIYYLKSSLLFLGHISIFFLFRDFLEFKEKIEKWIDISSLFSCILIFIFIFLKFSPYKNLVWWTFFLSSSIGNFTRLKGFGYEPSYFALSLAPLILFYISKIFSREIKLFQIFLIIGLLIGLSLAFSLGVFLGIGLSISISCLFFLHSFEFAILNRKKIGFSIFSAIVFFSGLVILFPNSALVVRLSDLINGKDLSGNSRLVDSFLLSFEIISQKSILFGVGLGQLKVVGFQIIKDFYNYTYLDSWAPAMPNSITDWLCNFGLVGVVAKLATEGYLFIKTRVFRDFFRFSCFVFIFIYQFTGGFLFCLPELVLWCLAFYAPNHFEFLPSAKWLKKPSLQPISFYCWPKVLHQKAPFFVYCSFILVCLGFFTSNFILSLGIIFFLLSLGFFQSFFQKIPGLFFSPFFLVQAGFFFLTLISVLWSENQSEAWIEVQSKLPFLIFPLFIHPQNTILQNAGKGLLNLFFMSGLVISVFCLLEIFLNPSIRFSFDNITYENLSKASGLQPIYLSYLLIFSMLSGYFLYRFYNWQHPIFITVALIFLYFFIILLSSRMEIMVVLVLSVAGLIHHFREKKGLILGAVLAVIVITLGTIFLSKTNQGRFLEMVDLNSTYAENKWGGRALRLEKWKFTLEAIIGNSIIGSGSGDYWFEMEKVYRKNNFELGLKEKFNSHNQYLQTALTLGFPGLVLLISILVFMLLQARKTNNFVLMLAVLSISLSMISESILERQTGIFLSVLFANLFYAISEFVNPKAARENSNLFKN